MKFFILLSIFIHLNISSIGQDPFILSIEQPELDYISDVVQIEDRFYFIQNRLFNLTLPFDSDSYSDIIITTDQGTIIEQYNLNGFQTHYQRILKVIENDIYLVGFIKSDSCKSKLVISKFNILTHSLDHLSSYDFCENLLLNIKIVKGLSQQTYLEEYHQSGSGHGVRKGIFHMDSSYNLSLVLDSLGWLETFSVDFSRRGYVIATVGLYNFYDADFNYRKQKFTNEFHFSAHPTHTPFGPHFILEQTFQDKYSDPDYGLQVRLVDSNLIIRIKTVLMPSHFFLGSIDMPYFGGIAIQNENEIWSAAKYGNQPTFDSSFYSITKLTMSLHVVCQHFLGYDSSYRLFGIRALESGGAIIFGNRVREGLGINVGEDIFALRVGENCELPNSVSTNHPQDPLMSISVYPNPGINDLTFSVNGFDAATLRVELINELGQILFASKDLTNSIHVPELPAGQYFYRILKDNKLLGAGPWVKQ